MNSFGDRFRRRPALPAHIMSLEPEEYAAILRDAGFGEHAIAKELAALADLQKRLAVPTPPGPNAEPANEIADPILAAAARRRYRARGGDDAEI